MPTDSTVRAVLLVVALTGTLAGCSSSIDSPGDAAPGATTETESTTQREPTTARDEPASAQIMDVLDESPQVSEVLVDETYVYERGCYNGTNGTASAYVRTGVGDESTSDSTREAVASRLYLVRMNVSTDTVTAVERAEFVPPEPAC